MSTKALQLYWSQFKSFTKSNWKYILAFGVGSFVSTIFSFLFTKSMTGSSTGLLIFKYIMLKEETKYRNVLNYNGFNKTESSIRPSTQAIACHSFFGKSKNSSPLNANTSIAEIRNEYKKARKQMNNFRFPRYGLKSYVETPKEIIIKPNSVNNNGPLKAFLLTYPGAKSENGIILYIHGGGHLGGFPEQGYEPLQVMGQYLGMTALCVEYHYCPEISVPQQVDECIEAYKYILNTMKIDPRKIFCVGDSAGGTLTLLLLQKLNKLNLEQPCGAVLLSAQCDSSAQTALETEQNGYPDAMFNVCPAFFDLCIDDEDRKEWDNANKEQRVTIARYSKYSPLNGDWKGLCPLYINSSYQDVLLGDSKLICGKCKEYGIEYESAFDSYLLHATTLWCSIMPEARDRLIVIIEWMRKQLTLKIDK